MRWQETIRDWLEKEERSQSYLARKAGINENYLSAILNDLRQPGPKVLRKLDRAMGLTPGTLNELHSQMELPMEEADSNAKR